MLIYIPISKTMIRLSYEDTLIIKDELAPLILPDEDEASAVRLMH